MAKTLVSPLFLIITFLLLVSLYLFSRLASREKNLKKEKIAAGLVLLATLVLAVISTPIFANNLVNFLEATYQEEDILTPDDEIEIVTILSGGINQGPGEELDILGGSSAQRVIRGVKYFKKSNADYLIMQGGLMGEDPGRMTELMKELALIMGVDRDRVWLEKESNNTREHPEEILKLPIVSADTNLAVVTSAWHLWRSEREFARYFSELTMVPAEFLSHDEKRGIMQFFPSTTSLKTTTRTIQELIGILWYQIRHQIS